MIMFLLCYLPVTVIDKSIVPYRYSPWIIATNRFYTVIHRYFTFFHRYSPFPTASCNCFFTWIFLLTKIQKIKKKIIQTNRIKQTINTIPVRQKYTWSRRIQTAPDGSSAPTASDGSLMAPNWSMIAADGFLQLLTAFLLFFNN